MTKRIIAFALLLSLLLSSPIYASEERPLLIALESSVLQGPDSDTPIEDVTIIVDKGWFSYNNFQATWTMPSGRPVEINSELYPSTRSIEEEHFLVGRASSRGNRYHAELMRVDRYPFQVTEEGDWEASEDITLFIPFTDRETETEYFLVSSLTEDQYQQLHQRSVVNYDGYVSAYNDYRRRHDSDFNPEGNTDYQEDYYWKLYYSERPDYPTETTRLTFQGPSIHVNSEGEVVHGFSDKASAPMAAAEPLGLMSFSDGSPSAANTSITIKSLDDFQNYNQFEAFLRAVDNGLYFSDGTASVEVVYTRGNPLKETLHIYEELFFAPVARGKALLRRERSHFYIVVQAAGSAGGTDRPSAAAVFSVLEQTPGSSSQTLTVSEIHHIAFENTLSSRQVAFKLDGSSRLLGPGHPIKRVEMVESIDYSPYEGYVSRLEQMLLDFQGDSEINTDLDAFVAFLQNLTENPRDHESMPYYLPPVIRTKVTSGDVTPTVLYYLRRFGSDWVGLFPYGDYVVIGLNEINRAINERFNLDAKVDYTIYTRGAPLSIQYAESFVSQIENDNNSIFTPTPDQAGNIRKGLVRQVGLQVEHGYLQKIGDHISVEIEMMTLPDDLSGLMEHFTEEQQAQLLDENTGLKPMPYEIHTDYSMVIGGKVHYFDNMDRHSSW